MSQTTEVSTKLPYRWQTAITHRDVVEGVVNSRYSNVHQWLNLTKEDLIQVGLEIAARASHYAPDNMRGYLYASVRKGLADYVRGHGRPKARRRLRFTGIDRSQPASLHESGFDGVEDQAEGRYLFDVAARVIDALPALNRERIRERFRLRFEKGLEFQEIADVQGVSFQAVQQSVQRVLGGIRDRLD